jgi:hypothetical protein
MKIQVRKIVEETRKAFDENTQKYYKYKIAYENGYVEELEIEPKDVSAFSMDKSLRLIGIGKNLYPLTLKSWKNAKKELTKFGVLQQLDYSKGN